MGRCDRCSAFLDGGVLVCPECGSVRKSVDEREMIECENHRGERAVGCCVVCGKPVCGDCCRASGIKFFCDDAEHERLSAEWETLVVTGSVFEADMMTVNLAQRDFEVRVFPWGNHAESFWFSELSRVRIMLLRQKVAVGRRVLESLGLAQDSGDGSSEEMKTYEPV